MENSAGLRVCASLGFSEWRVAVMLHFHICFEFLGVCVSFGFVFCLVLFCQKLN